MTARPVIESIERQFRRVIPIVIVILVASCASKLLAESSRPNIVLFIADNWSWPHAGALGDRTVQTPVFDRIANEGMLLTRAFCPVPSCSPTRASILTGRAAHQLEEAASLWSPFQNKFKVFTEYLRSAGYEVGFTGKGWSPGRFLEYGWSENPVGKEYPSFAEFMAVRDKSKPFFFWNGNTDTALYKWRWEAADWDGIDASTLTIPPYLPDVPAVRESLMAYYAAVRQVDRAAGQVVDRLQDDQLLDQTLLIYTSDNGWQMPRGLANCYDTGTRVPMAIRWKGRIAASSSSPDFISLTDLAPTILEAAGIDCPAAMTGRSFLNILHGQSDSEARDHVFVERERHANVRKGDLSYPIRGIRTEDFLYLWNMRPDRWPAGDPIGHVAVGDFGDVDGSRAKLFMVAQSSAPEVKPFFDLSFSKRPEEELYDLRSDPHQLRNVAAQSAYAPTLNRLRERVRQWMRDTHDPRVDPSFDGWDKYPYFGGNFRDRDAVRKAKTAR